MPDPFGFVGTGRSFVVASRYRAPQPHEALIISGRREGSAMKVVRGGGVIFRPLLDKVGRLRLTARQIPGVERYASLRLAQLDQRGSRPVRAAWRMARERVERDYAELTLAELLARFARPGRAN